MLEYVQCLNCWILYICRFYSYFKRKTVFFTIVLHFGCIFAQTLSMDITTTHVNNGLSRRQDGSLGVPFVVACLYACNSNGIKFANSDGTCRTTSDECDNSILVEADLIDRACNGTDLWKDLTTSVTNQNLQFNGTESGLRACNSFMSSVINPVAIINNQTSGVGTTVSSGSSSTNGVPTSVVQARNKTRCGCQSLITGKH